MYKVTHNTEVAAGKVCSLEFFFFFFFLTIDKDLDKSSLREQEFLWIYSPREIVYSGKEDVVAGIRGWLGHIAPILKRQ